MSTNRCSDFEIRLSFHIFLPLIDLLWSSSVREHLTFLQSNEKSARNILKNYYKKNTDKTYGHVIGFGPLRYKWSDDNHIYVRAIVNQIKNNMPLRPLFPLAPKKITWERVKSLSPKINNANIVVRYYLNLIAEVEGAFSVINPNKNELESIRKQAKQIFWDEVKSRKISILKAIFEDYRKVYVEFSNIFEFIETKFDYIEDMSLIDDISKLRHLPGCWVEELKKNSWLVVYSQKNPPRKFRKRVKRAFLAPIMIKTLRTYVKDALNRNILDELTYCQKQEFIEFIINHLDPNFYSSECDRTYFLPKHYQRVIFSAIEEKTKEKEQFKGIMSRLAENIAIWGSSDQLLLLNIKGQNAIKLRSKLKLKFRKIEDPELTKKQKLLLQLIISHFKECVTEFGPKITAEKIKTDKLSSYGLNLTQIREKIIEWKQGEKFGSELFSINELKYRDNPTLKSLLDLGLIEAVKAEKGNVKDIYVPNISNPYVRKMVFGAD